MPPSTTTQQAGHKLACFHCGYTWFPRIAARQVKCPNCQSRKWDQAKPVVRPNATTQRAIRDAKRGRVTETSMEKF